MIGGVVGIDELYHILERDTDAQKCDFLLSLYALNKSTRDWCEQHVHYFHTIISGRAARRCMQDARTMRGVCARCTYISRSFALSSLLLSRLHDIHNICMELGIGSLLIGIQFDPKANVSIPLASSDTLAGIRSRWSHAMRVRPSPRVIIEIGNVVYTWSTLFLYVSRTCDGATFLHPDLHETLFEDDIRPQVEAAMGGMSVVTSSVLAVRQTPEMQVDAVMTHMDVLRYVMQCNAAESHVLEALVAKATHRPDILRDLRPYSNDRSNYVTIRKHGDDTSTADVPSDEEEDLF